MNEESRELDALSSSRPDFGMAQEPSPRQIRGHTALAWIVILIGIAGFFFVHEWADRFKPGVEQNDKDVVGVLVMNIQAKYVVGVLSYSTTASDAALIYTSLKPLNAGTLDQRQRFVILAGEIIGADEAAKTLQELDALIQKESARTDQPFKMTPEQEAIQQVLHKLYDPPESSPPVDEADQSPTTLPAARAANVHSLTTAERELLVKELGWFGHLALAPPQAADMGTRQAVLQPARLVLYGAVIGIVLLVAAGAVGFVGLLILLVLALRRRLKSGLALSQTPHGLYAETFAIWIVLFLGLQVAAGLAGSLAPQWSLVMVGAGFFGSLIALVWPVIRGVPWTTVRQDIGWTLGRRPVLEPLIGPAGYLMGLPIFAVGVLITLGLLLVQNLLLPPDDSLSPAGGPVHPIVEKLIEAGWPVQLQLILLGSIAAPIVEETMFRGVLYRHLRGATGKWPIAMSIIIAGAINSFIFGLIHPQGLVTVPALMSLAFAFSLMREWRGTLIPSMIMHSIQNSLAFGILILATKS